MENVDVDLIFRIPKNTFKEFFIITYLFNISSSVLDESNQLGEVVYDLEKIRLIIEEIEAYDFIFEHLRIPINNRIIGGMGEILFDSENKNMILFLDLPLGYIDSNPLDALRLLRLWALDFSNKYELKYFECNIGDTSELLFNREELNPYYVNLLSESER